MYGILFLAMIVVIGVYRMRTGSQQLRKAAIPVESSAYRRYRRGVRR